MNERNTHPFIDHLQQMAERDDRGALAALRRGLGRPPGTAAEMFRFVEPFLPQNRPAALENACYLIASLFALHPSSTSSGNLGAHLALARSERDEDALERRFLALLSAHPDDLPDYLRQTISFLKSKDEPVNWNQLFWDIQNWSDEDHRVQKDWAKAFWARRQPEEEIIRTVPASNSQSKG